MSPQSETKAMNYLQTFGYLKPVDARAGRLRTEYEVIIAIKMFQMYAGIPMTGKVDEDTMKMVVMPRCGMSDFGPSDRTRRRRRYAIQGTTWDKKRLTYMFQGGPRSSLSTSEVKQKLTEAFKEWERVADLKFISVDDPQADILVRFRSGSHNDGYPFDGIGGTLAHGFYPHNNEGLSGDVHFDDDEEWVLSKEKPGTDFYWTALHEIGHSLGLDHSNNKDAVMYPFYTGFKTNLQLNNDDIRGIRYIYGMPKITINTAPPPTMVPSPSMVSLKTHAPGMPNACNTSFDAVFLGADEVTYFIAGKHYWTVLKTGERNGPFVVTNTWNKLPVNGIDAAYQSNGKITFFKGTSCWVYNGTEYIEGPTPIFAKFKLDPFVDRIDAAFVWGANGKTYLFSGDRYWRYNAALESIDMGYPVPINASWVGVPDNIDSAVTWMNGKTYFFKGNGFWIFDNIKIIVTHFEPMKINMYWMKCLGIQDDQVGGINPTSQMSRSHIDMVILLGMLLSAMMNLW